MNRLHTLAAPAGGRTGYSVTGTHGDWLVLIHGWCGSAEHWSAIVPDLARDHRVVTVSLPGFGGMDAPPLSGRTIEAAAAAVAAVMRKVGANDATLIGHSMGGPIAVELAILGGALTRAVLGLDTLSNRGYYGRQTPDEIARRRIAVEADFAGEMHAMVDAIAHPTTPKATSARIADGMVAAPSDFALDIKDSLFAWDVEARWPRVTCPKMLLNSRHVARLAHPEPMACFADTKVALYESGHFPMIEAPELITDAIRDCLTELQRTGKTALNA